VDGTGAEQVDRHEQVDTNRWKANRWTGTTWNKWNKDEQVDREQVSEQVDRHHGTSAWNKWTGTTKVPYFGN